MEESVLKRAVMAPSRGRYINSGRGPTMLAIDIGHKEYMGLVDPDTAFWALVKCKRLASISSDPSFSESYREKFIDLSMEMETLRFGLKPAAVYFNPTERCNLNCCYCYIPEGMRRNGAHMSVEKLMGALQILKDYFKVTVSSDRLPQIIFHGAEPLLNRRTVFQGIERFKDDFRFGIQTNATLLDKESIDFFTEMGVGIGISLDGPNARIANLTRYDWGGAGVFEKILSVLELLRGYEGFNVICTVTKNNMQHLPEIVDFFHEHKVPVCMLNMIRCTLPRAQDLKPLDHEVAGFFFKALDQSYNLYERTGRKLVVANFANILVSILAPTARRLMCDISPCGGGRCFFAVAANGDTYPCSEFIGLPDFKGGNLFNDRIEDILASEPFSQVTGRRLEAIVPCKNCAIRHFCGSPCPAEAYSMNGALQTTGAFCEFYEEQVRYALRLIADGREDSFLWDGWNRGTENVIDITY